MLALIVVPFVQVQVNVLSVNLISTKMVKLVSLNATLDIIQIQIMSAFHAMKNAKNALDLQNLNAPHALLIMDQLTTRQKLGMGFA